ncbi:F5/8 type C domain-containing protein [Besnoitia besnoiti]|uniref:F5/8 type C domain-containing protein n=1 Tax=Besnoitia besnoiti TaxID=94643 RepID=A0A2A9MKL1_BESBE|nr:F5/8 type C domain-containing protein [Besnoitia besnoiti]PFH35970.1 F5/8 type C domain-containing protein [Besnoitia besnoiti]
MQWFLSRSRGLVILLCAAWSAIGCYAVEHSQAADAIEKTYIKIDAAEASSVYPSVGANGMREYSPDKALTKGSGYWSSEGNHKKEVVSWTGILKSRRTVEGIDINWAYAPGKVSVFASFDGKEPFQELVPFEDTNAPSDTFDQQIVFPHQTRVKAIRILMKDARYEYFGINLVQLVGTGNPIIRIQSGITSPHQDMCLQIDEHDDVVLDGCLASIPAMDGRALWKYNELGQLYNPIKNKCMVLKDNIDLDGGVVVAEDCEQSYKYDDGRSIWELQPNNQLKLLKGGNFCLSQQGSKAGMANVAKNKPVKASHPRPGDSSHSPSLSVDGHSETYWASQNFPMSAVPSAVFLDIDLGEKYKLNTAAIDWEYPAMSYSISSSEDGKAFGVLARNSANSLYSTMDDLKSSVGRYIRLTLEKPHPVNAYSSLSDQLAHLDDSLRAAAKLFGPESTSSLTPGYSEASPVKDCYTLKNVMPQMISGFYYLAPTCAPKVLRAYCDSEYGGTYFVPPAYGLQPIHLHSANQLWSLHRLLKLMGVDLNNPVPLGISNGGESYYSLDLKKDVWHAESRAGEAQGRNTVGIGSEGLVFFDSSEVEMAAIICSTNQDVLTPPPAYIDVSCATAPGGNSAFDGPPGTTVTVKCPQNCLFTGTQAAIRQLEALANARIGSISPSVIESIEEQASKVISNARGILKPAGVLEAELRARAAELLSKTTLLTERLRGIAGRVASTLERTNRQLQQAIATRASQTQADSWALTSFNPSEFYDVFNVHNSKTAIGAGNWVVGGAPAGGRGGRNILSQTAVVAPANPAIAAVGAYASLRNKRFFDVIFTTDVYITGSGSIGIAFRMKDFGNMFLFEMHQTNGGFKRLLRIADGTPIEVARVDDGGYLEGKWYTVRIEMREARLRISVVEESAVPMVVEPEPIIDLIDGYFMSGSIGFFSSGVDGAYFDMVRVDALPCVLRTEPLPPKPATCSNYKESFVGSVRKNWSVSENDTEGGPARWEYRTNVGGEAKVLAQMSSVRGREEHTPSIAVLGGNRGCESGTFSFKVLPQCENGIVGAVFKYKDPHSYMLFEMGPSFARLRKRTDGSFTTSAKSFLAGYRIGRWNSISITFSGGNVVVNDGRGGSPIPVFSILARESWEGGAVGFATWNCGGVAFADISLHPMQESHLISNPFGSSAINFVEVDTEADAGMQICLSRKHALERMEFCDNLRPKLETTAEKCRTNFCDVCCEQELPVSAKARNTCKKQCHKSDAESTPALEALEATKTGCSIEPSKSIYRVCEGERDVWSCQQEICEMCCETAKTPSGESHRARKLFALECKKSCALSVPVAQQEM